MKTPFLELAENVNKLKIKATGYDLNNYKTMLKNVLIRLNDYFVKNGFYEYNDYLQLIDMLITNPKYYFQINSKLPTSVRGRFYKSTIKNSGHIEINRNSFYDLENTEGYLCHEFIHLISLGMDYITYFDNGKKVEIVLPDNVGLKAGYKKYYLKDGKTETQILTYSDLCANSFLKEGLTELLKQQIYDVMSSTPTYQIQTRFIEFLNFASRCKLEQSFKDFLQGDLVTYKKALTKEEYSKLDNELKLFLEEYKTNKDLYSCKHYINANGIVVKMALRQFEKTKPSMQQFLEYIDSLAKKVIVFNKENFLENSINSATKIFNKNITRNKKATTEFIEKYKSLVNAKEQEIWYSYPINRNKGFKLNGFSEEIYYLGDLSTKKVQANLYDTNLTSLLLPEKYNVVYSLGNNSIEQNKILISRVDKKSFKYQQGNLVRIVNFDNDKCDVLDENGKIIDSGYIVPYKNKALKEEEYKKEVADFSNFFDKCLDEKREHILANNNSVQKSNPEQNNIEEDSNLCNI